VEQGEGGVSWQILEGDCRDVLATLPAASVQTCVTSPPYFGLRDYGTGEWDGGDSGCDHQEVQPQNRPGRETPGGRGGTFPTTERAFRDRCGKCGARRVDRQIGLESTPDEFVQALVGVFREVRRVLRDDGTVWLNLGDSYHGGGYSNHSINGEEWLEAHGGDRRRSRQQDRINANPGLKPKDLIGVPWMVAFALRADGWYLRSDIIWHKPNPMPESVTDRPTKAHEYLFLLSKGPRYFYDADAIREAPALSTLADARIPYSRPRNGNQASVTDEIGHPVPTPEAGRNKRSVWTVSTQPYSGAHFATFSPKLIEPCILAGSRAGDVVLDPFNGAGTTGLVALRHGRSYVGIELNAEYADMARWRLRDDAPLLNTNLEIAA
jgi:DNA modification methylase